MGICVALWSQVPYTCVPGSIADHPVVPEASVTTLVVAPLGIRLTLAPWKGVRKCAYVSEVNKE